jgi:hypothetical protein
MMCHWAMGMDDYILVNAKGKVTAYIKVSSIVNK